MPTTLFFQSDIKDPYAVYESMLDKHPIFWDKPNQIWAIYSHEHCTDILNNTNAIIPTINPDNEQNLNEYALKIVNHLSRLSNGIQHEIAKETATLLFANMKLIDTNQIFSDLLNNNLIESKINWVNSVCKKLPVLVLLKSFGFEQNDCNFILEKIESLVKIMLPNKTEEQVQLINEASENIFSLTEKQLSNLSFYEPLLNKIATVHTLSLKKTTTICVSNLIGLFIQSYDAGRGILSNSLLQIINTNNSIFRKDIPKILIQKTIIETLRFDPPIHNTRRVATKTITLGKTIIKKNDAILLVLAAANRDPKKFDNAMNFDIERINNNDHLTFGTGGHMCLAKYFSTHLATETLFYLLNNYETIKILDTTIQYEPMINTRLPKAIWLSIQ